MRRPIRNGSRCRTPAKLPSVTRASLALRGIARAVSAARAGRGRCAAALCCGREDMGETHTGFTAIHRQHGVSAALGAADFLYLAATPTFAIMALLTTI